MANREYTLRIKDDSLNALFAYLSIGTLYAIQKSIVPPTVGIWTLGMPKIHKILENNPQFSKEILDVLQTMDELSAMQILLPDKFEQEITALIGKVQKELETPENQLWDFDWVNDEK